MTEAQKGGTQVRPVDFRTALDIDMATKGINERELGRLLGLSQQSISKWRHRGFPPLYRVDDLKVIFGPNSQIAKIDFAKFAADIPKLRISAPPNVPETRTVAAEDPLTAVRNWRNAQDLQIVGGIPAALRGNLTLHAEVGYASSKLAVGVLMAARGAPAVPERVAEKALRLLARKVTNPGLRVAVAVVEGDLASIHAAQLTERWERSRQSMAPALEALGVELWRVASGAEVAHRICDAEGVAFREATEVPDEFLE